MAIRTTTAHKLSGLLGMLHLHHTPRLFLALMRDRRVPWHLKLCAVSGLIYIFSPLDVTPDIITGNKLLDDVIVSLLIMQAFLELAPRGVVEEHCARLNIDPAKVFVNVPRTVLDAIELYELAKPWLRREHGAATAPEAVPGAVQPDDAPPPPYTRYSAYRTE